MEESDVVEPEHKRNDPDLYMLNATINQFDTAGELQHRISANRFTHFPLTDLTTMVQPELTLGEVDQSNPWEITARQGRLLPESNYREEIVELWTQVLAEKSGISGHFINIQTESLTVYPARDYAETDEKVYIDNQNGRTTAAGMKAYFDTGKFQFFSRGAERVTTIFLPN